VTPRVSAASGGGSGTQTSILGAGAKPPDPWYRRLAARLPAARYIAIIVVGIAVVGGGIAYGITQLGEDTSTGGETPASKAADSKRERRDRAPAIEPSDVSVTVLNGTTVTNLAHNYGTKLDGQGFEVENQLTANRGQVAESVVLFKPGANREAALVARKLGISQIEPADPESTSQAGAAEVVVVIGADLASSQ
jgi:hypothetical protein